MMSSSSLLRDPLMHVGVVGAVAGTAGTPFVIAAIKDWYRKIPLPSWTPPDRVFAPTWTSLYAMMGIATSRVVASSGFSPPVLHFFAHYMVNLAWAPVFFGLKKLRLAFVMNVALIASLTTRRAFAASANPSVVAVKLQLRARGGRPDGGGLPGGLEARRVAWRDQLVRETAADAEAARLGELHVAPHVARTFAAAAASGELLELDAASLEKVLRSEQLEPLMASDEYLANAPELVPRLQQRVVARLTAASASLSDARY